MVDCLNDAPIFISRGRDLVLHPLEDLLQLCEYCSLVAVS